MNEIEAFLILVSEFRNRKSLFLSCDIYHDDLKHEFVVNLKFQRTDECYHLRNKSLSKCISEALIFLYDIHDDKINLK